MTSKKCFNYNCDLEVKYICKCSDFETYSCDLHFRRHLKLVNRAHHFESISSQPDEEIKGNQKEKRNKEKKMVVASKSKDQYQKYAKRQKVESDSAGWNSLNEEIQTSNNSEIEQELGALDLKLDTVKENSSDSIQNNEKALDEEKGLKIKKQTLLNFQLPSDNSEKWDLKSIKNEYNTAPLKSLSSEDLIAKISVLWNEGNNPQIEQDFRRIYSLYKSGKSILDPELKKNYLDYISAYHKITSLCYFPYGRSIQHTELYIYDTESENGDIKVLNTPKPLTTYTCIAQLPNGELFCYGNDFGTGIALIIDKDFNIRMLPKGLCCLDSSAIYFNRNIYCFGGHDGSRALALSYRFDLDRNQWFKLANLPEADMNCSSVRFNGNILISGLLNEHILIYSTDIDSFSWVSHRFLFKTCKTLISTDRLYLIERKHVNIYESEIGDEYTWKIIVNSNSQFGYSCYPQYCTYNKGRIYLGHDAGEYWKFFTYHIKHDLNECFKHNCDLEVKYICKCSNLETFSCDFHFARHLKLANRAHHFESISSQPDEEIKRNQKEKRNKEKKIVVASKSKNQYKKHAKRQKIESDSAGWNSLNEEIQTSNNSEIEQSKAVNLKLETIKENSSDSLQNNKTLKSKALDEERGLKVKKQTLLDFHVSSDNSRKWDVKSIKNEHNKTPLRSLCSEELVDKISVLWNEGNNPEIEQDFRRIYSLYKSGKSISDPELKEIYQDYISAYHKITSLYYFPCGRSIQHTQLYIYDTEKEKGYIKVLNTPEIFTSHTCIAQLPNSELFCYGNDLETGIALIIDKNFNTRRLPNGPRCLDSSAIYFNKNIYCFGGFDGLQTLALSVRFDLDTNQWFKLANLPRADINCSSVRFNGNIVISGLLNGQILIYSTDIDSFSWTSYHFFHRTCKTLVSTDRLYLIERRYINIYESEIGDEYAWKIIVNSNATSDYNFYSQYCAYNKGRIHLGGDLVGEYWNFDLNKKALAKICLR